MFFYPTFPHFVDNICIPLIFYKLSLRIFCKQTVNYSVEKFFVGKCGEIWIFFTIFAVEFKKPPETRFQMTTFIGNIDARLDEKGRIFIPAAYRKVLAEYDSRRVVLRRDPDNECLVFYPEEVWNKKVQELQDTLDEWDPDDMMLLMQFTSDAEWLEPDNQGRVLLQKRNLEQTGADQDVVFVGMLNKFALWSRQRFEEKRMPQKDFAAALRQKMKK